MNLPRIVLCAFLAGALIACSSFVTSDGPSRIAVQYATARMIEADPDHRTERAQKIREIVSDARGFFDQTDSTVQGLREIIQQRVAALQLAPADRLLAMALADAVISELNARVGAGSLPPESRLRVSAVLGWVEDAAELYQ